MYSLLTVRCRQLVDNFSGFFDKIIQNLTEIAGALPQYDDIVSLFNEPVSLRVTRHLEEIYANVFAFFEIVAKVFTKSDGSMCIRLLPLKL